MAIKTREALDRLSKDERKDLDDIIVPEYVDFLNTGKISERVVREAKKMLLANGFVEYEEGMILGGREKGIYFEDDDGVNFAAVKFGALYGIENGFNVVGAHNDSPCLETKPRPIKETIDGIVLDTNYYGGIVSHQMFARKYNIVGSVINKNGEEFDVDLRGTIVDPAPHIARSARAGKKYEQIFRNEDLDVYTGFRTKKELLAAMGNGITEKDLEHGRIYCTPDTEAEAMGEVIVGYGHDDRVCVYSMVKAIIEAEPTKVSIAYGVDREEIGSTGYSGAQGKFFERVLKKYYRLERFFEEDMSYSTLDDIYENSKCISADVCIAENYRNKLMVDTKNAAKYGKGLGVITHSGGGGKYGGNFASARFMNEMRQVFNEAGAIYQIAASPSKVDQGGGGTIAKFFGERGIKTVDVGVPVAGMHSPEEVIHKGDLYQAIKCFKAVFES